MYNYVVKFYMHARITTEQKYNKQTPDWGTRPGEKEEEI